MSRSDHELIQQLLNRVADLEQKDQQKTEKIIQLEQTVELLREGFYSFTGEAVGSKFIRFQFYMSELDALHVQILNGVRRVYFLRGCGAQVIRSLPESVIQIDWAVDALISQEHWDALGQKAHISTFAALGELPSLDKAKSIVNSLPPTIKKLGILTRTYRNSQFGLAFYARGKSTLQVIELSPGAPLLEYETVPVDKKTVLRGVPSATALLHLNQRVKAVYIAGQYKEQIQKLVREDPLLRHRELELRDIGMVSTDAMPEQPSSQEPQQRLNQHNLPERDIIYPGVIYFHEFVNECHPVLLEGMVSVRPYYGCSPDFLHSLPDSVRSVDFFSNNGVKFSREHLTVLANKPHITVLGVGYNVEVNLIDALPRTIKELEVRFRSNKNESYVRAAARCPDLESIVLFPGIRLHEFQSVPRNKKIGIRELYNRSTALTVEELKALPDGLTLYVDEGTGARIRDLLSKDPSIEAKQLILKDIDSMKSDPMPSPSQSGSSPKRPRDESAMMALPQPKAKAKPNPKPKPKPKPKAKPAGELVGATPLSQEVLSIWNQQPEGVAMHRERVFQ